MSQPVLSRETIRLMMQGQRIVKKEFGVRIQLHDDQAIARLIAYAAQSSSSELKDCSSQLMRLLVPGTDQIPTDEEDLHTTSARNIYRGQEIEKPAQAPQDPAVSDDRATPTRNTVIYRGRRLA